MLASAKTTLLLPGNSSLFNYEEKLHCNFIISVEDAHYVYTCIHARIGVFTTQGQQKESCLYNVSELLWYSTGPDVAFKMVDVLYKNWKNRSCVKAYHFLGKI